MIGTQKKYVSQFTMMGTVISLTLFEPNQLAVEAVYDYLQRMDGVFSVNRADSELAAINQYAGIHPVLVSTECFQLVSDAIKYTKQYADSFNVLIGPLVKLWKIGFGGHQVPAAKEIRQRLALLDTHEVILDEAQSSIYLRQPGMQLDLGAIAKGYFADQVVKQLQQAGITSAIVNLGGNVKLLGINPLTDNQRWQVGIQAPEAPRGYPALQVEMPARTVVTSGIFERYFKIGNHRYHHILDPRTGYPVENQVDQVSIITERSELAEVLSTVAYFEGPSRGRRLIEQLPHTEAIFIDHEQQVTVTSGLTPRRKGVFTIE
ncbi:FAD:protein FMN transferase [Lactiplantibacillus paraplantarum]|uniref:FAD:protein FMN transferase n=1 Tax=Lactiplantibacillus paraplantarum TaxID=60520 RepID=UPI0021A553E4|nr:FAD:protein FMN transferase [Lactiplantibacillus paraplantarum]MCT4456780.1 FAD:protein FMN transferase [Lactiplantibacillus paraplantarum]